MAKKLLTTPKGVAKYPWLTKADAKFGDPKYKVDLIVPDDAEGLDGFTAKLADLLNEHFENIKEERSGEFDDIVLEEVPWFEEEDGTAFRCGLNKSGKNKKTGETWENKISFYSAGGKPLDSGSVPKIGGGSVLRISIEPRLWTMPDSEGRGKSKKTFLKVGISLRIKGVQILEVHNITPTQSAEDHGFGEEEGFEYNPDEFAGTGSDDSGNPDDFV